MENYSSVMFAVSTSIPKKFCMMLPPKLFCKQIITYFLERFKYYTLGGSMNEKEILSLWRKGLSKHKVAEIYKRRYNQQIKLIRAKVVNRHAGKFIGSYEALAVVEKIIYKYLQEKCQF